MDVLLVVGHGSAPLPVVQPTLLGIAPVLAPGGLSFLVADASASMGGRFTPERIVNPQLGNLRIPETLAVVACGQIQ